MGSGSARSSCPILSILPHYRHQQVGHFYPAHFSSLPSLTFSLDIEQNLRTRVFYFVTISTVSLRSHHFHHLCLCCYLQFALCSLSLICWCGSWTQDSGRQLQSSNSIKLFSHAGNTSPPHHLNGAQKGLGGTSSLLSSLIRPLTDPLKML